MNKTFSIDFTGPAEIIDASIDAFVARHGYQSGDKVAFARLVFRQFAMDSIAQHYADQAAIAAATAAKAQAGGAIDLVTMTATVA